MDHQKVRKCLQEQLSMTLDEVNEGLEKELSDITTTAANLGDTFSKSHKKLKEAAEHLRKMKSSIESAARFLENTPMRDE